MFNIVLYTVFKIPRVFKIVSAISGSFLLLNYLNEVRLPLVTCLGCSMLFINKAVQATMKPHHTHLFGEILDLLKGLPSGERVHMPRLFQMKISLRGLCSFPERCSFRCFSERPVWIVWVLWTYASKFTTCPTKDHWAWDWRRFQSWQAAKMNDSNLGFASWRAGNSTYSENTDWQYTDD